MTTKTQDAITAAYETAQGRWSGWDWPHSFGAIDDDCAYCCERVSVCGTSIVLEGPLDDEPPPDACEHYRAAHAEALEYDGACRSDAAAAEDLAAEAMEHLAAGRIAAAISCAQQVSQIESRYGDDPTWGAWRKLIDQMETVELNERADA